MVKEVKEDFSQNKSIYFELNKHIPKDANILHYASDFGQKDVLLTLQQASRRIFTFIKDEERRETAEQTYVVKRRKISYIKDTTEINKKIDMLLISDENFDINTVTELPETVIFVNIKNTSFENNNYTLDFRSESLKVFRSE